MVIKHYGERVNIIGLQMDIAWEDKPANFEKVRQLTHQAKPALDSLVVLPEMFATGFTMNVSAMAEPYHGKTEQFLAGLAKQYGVYVIGGAATRNQAGKARNKALVFAPSGELIGFYSKIKPFAPGGESEHYAAGARPTAIKCGDVMIAPFVCYDLRFPELFRQVAAEHRPELYVVIANWPEKRIAHWVRLLQARAIENQAYVIGLNRVGVDPYYSYAGRSVMVDFNGDIVADGGPNEGVIQAQVDLELLRKYREGLPFLADLKF